MLKTNTVIIPTPGLGSRMGDLTKNLNKALLPFNNKPVLAHIIEQFPKDTRFIIPIGFKADQIQNFCKLAYSNRNIEFVTIDDYTSNQSGPGYTMRKCLEKINEPFWYIPCDTYFQESLSENVYTEDTIFVKKVDSDLSHLYTMFKLDSTDRLIDITFKQTQNENWYALTGVMYIYDWKGFSRRLTDNNSPEIIWAIKLNSKTAQLASWQDFGNLEIYQKAFAESQQYDFTKINEFTYICNKKVIKWWSDPTIAEKKFIKYLTNPKVYPSNCKHQGEWLSYDYFQGTTVYENHNTDILEKLLIWLDKEVWIPQSIDIRADSERFYKKKTFQRIHKFLEKYPKLEDAYTVNDVKVKPYTYYLNKINWDLLEKTNLPGYMHGDLHFDNTIVNKNKEFKIIDWRHEFADLIETGDIYYDLAKLSGGFIIDYSKIKENKFTYENINGDVKLRIPTVENSNEYLTLVENFIKSKGWNYSKVQLLIPLIFWNMSPLHAKPFDKFLWYLGIKLFEELKL